MAEEVLEGLHAPFCWDRGGFLDRSAGPPNPRADGDKFWKFAEARQVRYLVPILVFDFAAIVIENFELDPHYPG